ncbi:MAG TPA: hypothetical protein VE891_11780 [Allosphingosinicella sp.]|nr:hypothetical protein [Allosphingosinicella sp.]
MGVHYTGRPLDPTRFAGVRILFTDLHLLPASSGEKMQFAAIENVIRTNIDPRRGGPYLLVLWTKHEETVGRLATHLERRLEPDKKPLAVLSLDKAKFLEDGALKDAEGLRDAIIERVHHSAQLQALLGWEADVLAAAGATLAEVGELVPLEGRRDSLSFSRELDGVLSRLAVAAVGAPNVQRDKRGAINTALAPLLSDRILNSPAQAQDADLWASAITRAQDLPAVDDHQVGRMNRMLHLSLPPRELTTPGDWGAVIALPPEALSKGEMEARFGMQAATLLNQLFLVERADRPRCKLVLIRIGAICDYAQNKPGPILYVAGCIIPVSVVRRDSQALLSELASPIFEWDEAEGPVCLFVNARLQITMASAPEWPVLFRIRETLLRAMAEHCANYATRTGIIKWPL